VLKVFDHCARTSQTWQKELRDATGVSSSKVNRFIDVAEEQGWIERPASRTADAKKPLQMKSKGRQVMADFERLFDQAVGENSRTAPPDPTGEAVPGVRR
jgi:DNA-binding MarR family transcriptional regulator